MNDDNKAKALSVLQHAIGADQHGHICRGGGRNHFVTGTGSTDYPTCMDLTERGLMKRYPGSAISGWDNVFVVTRAGQEYVRAESPKPPPAPKLTASQRRYRDYLADDCFLSFGDWLKWHSRRAT